MKRRFPGLHQASQSAEVPDGIYLVRVHRAQYRWHAQKPFYAMQFAVLEPKPLAGSLLSGRIYCTEKALWKLSWFLRDFGTTPSSLAMTNWTRNACMGSPAWSRSPTPP